MASAKRTQTAAQARANAARAKAQPVNRTRPPEARLRRRNSRKMYAILTAAQATLPGVFDETLQAAQTARIGPGGVLLLSWVSSLGKPASLPPGVACYRWDEIKPIVDTWDAP